MKLTLLLFTLGVLLVVAGYTQQLDTKCQHNVEVRIIPRNVYDQLIKDSSL